MWEKKVHRRALSLPLEMRPPLDPLTQIELRVLHAEFNGYCKRPQAAASSPELPLLRFLNYSIELKLCLEVVAAAGTVDIEAVAVG
ncbi:uncharacterized protein DS421_11g334260 [Arachis hypogaea]|nr:uncharacterized protein DS421_11g334260 [Arachis hypogaea]